MYTPGYYKTDHRALTLRELIRWYGLWRLPRMYLATRSKPPGVGVWMPALWADLECTKDDLSDRFWEATIKQRESFDRLGFVECGVGRLRPNMNLNPAYLDQGKINYLNASRSCIGGLLYSRIRATELVVIWFTSAFQEGNASCTNNKYSFDPIRGEKVIRINSDDVALIHERFLSRCSRRAETPRVLKDDTSLRAWFDAHQIDTFNSRARRGLFVKMSDQEIAEAKRKFPPPLPKGPAAA